MAEAFLKAYGEGNFNAESAGIEKGKLNPYVVQAIRETGIDISQNQTKDVFDVLKKGSSFDVVITVCEKEAAERCPIFPGAGKRMQWSFADPSKFTGTNEEILSQVRAVRDAIKEKVIEFVHEATE